MLKLTIDSALLRLNRLALPKILALSLIAVCSWEPMLNCQTSAALVGMQATGRQTVTGPTPFSIVQYAARPALNDARPGFRLPGEFERQRAIVLSVSDLRYQHNGVLKQIVEQTAGQVNLVILVNDQAQLTETARLLASLSCDCSHVNFFQLKLDTIWLRDFGPRLAENPTGTVSVDFFYEGQRPLDDKFPLAWSSHTRVKPHAVKWTLHGGNLLSNGKGLAIATSRIFDDNFIAFPNPLPGMNVEFERRKIVVDAFKKDCHIDQLLILEPLREESTRHVDMFATFLAPDLVLVAQVDPHTDPDNARVLDYNAQLLGQLKVDGQPMRVERIPVPPRKGKYWSAYTNIILANQLVLMPVYRSDPPEMVRNAIRIYRDLTPPGTRVEAVDMTSMQKLEGALHCMSVNVPEFAPLPSGLISYAQARAQTASTRGSANGVANARVAPNRPRETPALASSPAQPALRVPAKKTQQQSVATYRRKFTDRTKRYSLDAYAIGYASGVVYLIRSDNRQEVRVNLDRLSQEDRYWLSQNINKIRSNGKKVRAFLLNSNISHLD